MELFEIENLSFTYNGAETRALDGVSLRVSDGDFLLICGKSGCGKTTLLKLLKKNLAPAGKRDGKVLYKGENVCELDNRTAVSEIGFVMQNPDDQTVTDKVLHEIAFGLESLGEKSDVIRRKIAEISGFFGLGDIYDKKICELSGGQKQLVNLASVLVMSPTVVILDEPTAQLDPVAASSFLSSLKKLNDELGITVILVEHRLEEVFPMANKVVFLDDGKVVIDSSPEKICDLYEEGKENRDLFDGLPTAVRLFKATGGKGACPLTVKDGKNYVKANFNKNFTDDGLQVGGCREEILTSENEKNMTNEIAVEIQNGFFRYERNTPDVLDDLNLKIYKNEILCIFGANGAGKTTLLRVLSGTRRLYKGKYRLWGKKIKEYGNSLYRKNLTALPQNPHNLFLKSTVAEDLEELAKLIYKNQTERRAAVERVIQETGVSQLLKRHPYDLSGVETQKVALEKVLLTDTQIVLLDEPTKGLEAYSKKQIAELFFSLKKEGKTIVAVTHDIEFAADVADRCAMYFDGKIVSVADKYEFLSENKYYTTAAARITRENFRGAVTFARAVKMCNANRIYKNEG